MPQDREKEKEEKIGRRRIHNQTSKIRTHTHTHTNFDPSESLRSARAPSPLSTIFFNDFPTRKKAYIRKPTTSAWRIFLMIMILSDLHYYFHLNLKIGQKIASKIAFYQPNFSVNFSICPLTWSVSRFDIFFSRETFSYFSRDFLETRINCLVVVITAASSGTRFWKLDSSSDKECWCALSNLPLRVHPDRVVWIQLLIDNFTPGGGVVSWPISRSEI